MSGRIYTVAFEGVAVTVAADLFEITPADDKPVEIVGMFLSQSSDTGDAAEEMLRFEIIRGYTASGSGGTATTPRPVKRTDAAVGFTAETCNTTAATTGTAVILHADAFNIRSGYQNWWPEGTEPDASQGDTTILVRLMAAPADSLTLSGTLYVRELG